MERKNLDIYTVSGQVVVRVEAKSTENPKNKAKSKVRRMIGSKRDTEWELEELKEEVKAFPCPKKYKATFKITSTGVYGTDEEAIELFKKEFGTKPLYELVEDSIIVEDKEPGGDIV